jgi:hypothetical protein
LFHIVAATHTPRCFPGGLDCGQQQTNQNTDDGNHNQKLHQSEPSRFESPTILFNDHTNLPNKKYILRQNTDRSLSHLGRQVNL